MGLDKNFKNLYFFALAARGEGLSGSDRIFIELAKRWSDKFHIEIFLWDEGFKMCQRQGLDKSAVKFHIMPLKKWQKVNFAVNYVFLIIKSVWLASKLELKNQSSTIVYSASDFWMDSLPGWILKCRYPKIQWIGTWYLTAPLKLLNLNNLFYWLSQRPIYLLIKKWADFVFVTSDPDKLRFIRHIKKKKVLVVRGGVDLAVVNFWQMKFSNLPKKYDAVFQGRFHPQKGVAELIDIWKLVVNKRQNAKLIMIGDGPLMKRIKEKVKREKLESNIILKGYMLDGVEKYKIFYQSRIVVHPAVYDSGGMSAAEAMAWGLPGVSFDIDALKTYYPRGMLKAHLGDKEEFARLIKNLLDDPKLYDKIAQEAEDLILKYWDWDARSEEILSKL